MPYSGLTFTVMTPSLKINSIYTAVQQLCLILVHLYCYVPLLRMPDNRGNYALFRLHLYHYDPPPPPLMINSLQCYPDSRSNNALSDPPPSCQLHMFPSATAPCTEPCFFLACVGAARYWLNTHEASLFVSHALPLRHKGKEADWTTT